MGHFAESYPVGSKLPEPEPIHGQNGWILADYRYNEMTGVGRFIYMRGGNIPETRVVHREQKTHYTKDAEPIILDRFWEAT